MIPNKKPTTLQCQLILLTLDGLLATSPGEPHDSDPLLLVSPAAPKWLASSGSCKDNGRVVKSIVSL